MIIRIPGRRLKSVIQQRERARPVVTMFGNTIILTQTRGRRPPMLRPRLREDGNRQHPEYPRLSRTQRIRQWVTSSEIFRAPRMPKTRPSDILRCGLLVKHRIPRLTPARRRRDRQCLRRDRFLSTVLILSIKGALPINRRDHR